MSALIHRLAAVLAGIAFVVVAIVSIQVNERLAPALNDLTLPLR